MLSYRSKCCNFSLYAPAGPGWFLGMTISADNPGSRGQLPLTVTLTLLPKLPNSNPSLRYPSVNTTSSLWYPSVITNTFQLRFFSAMSSNSAELRCDPEKKPKDYSMPCEKLSNESVYDVRTRATNHVRQADQ